MYFKPRESKKWALAVYKLASVRSLGSSLSLTFRFIYYPSVSSPGLYTFTFFPFLSDKLSCYIISSFFQLNYLQITELDFYDFKFKFSVIWSSHLVLYIQLSVL